MQELENVAEFRFSPDLKDDLNKYGIKKVFKDGDVILNEGAYIRSIPIILKGMMKVIRTEDDGREILLYYVKTGESCIMSFLGGMHNDTSKVQAIIEEETEILFVPIEKVSLFIKEYPQWLDYIFRMYHKRFEELLEIVNAIAFKKVDKRLLDLIKLKTENAQSHIIITTHEQLANELGTARVVVSRLLKKLEEDGIVKLGRNKITLLEK
ncbi:MAG: Crp/Fnr family transcriptional regulator [Chitinophagales bacterium]|nr:Crp/Fnr family transcriptional regulator [Chitinophagales bacterium]